MFCTEKQLGNTSQKRRRRRVKHPKVCYAGEMAPSPMSLLWLGRLHHVSCIGNLACALKPVLLWQPENSKKNGIRFSSFSQII
ncbi:hypothetical protein RchiOBHm_Chr5g0060351 [Rosa chinensis]|uniref:Uncharacterized protein n=1 Tax=Rosa chinensis TaxID=74649 RepID=A0A2P6QHM9_ROSCH|nr:hypothetical protein RchiOBHm_Chr5g0060351 [Rosa chinensis]